MQRIRSNRLRQLEDLRKLISVVTRDRGIDLHRHAEIFQITEAGNGGVECTWNAAKSIMRQRISSVQADGNALDAVVNDFARHLLSNQCAICGQRDAQTLVCSTTRQLENIRAEKRLTAAKHEDGGGDLGDLVDDIARCLSR